MVRLSFYLVDSFMYDIQKATEFKHSHKSLIKDLEVYLQYNFMDKIHEGVQLLVDYCTKRYSYKSKNNRVQTFSDNNDPYEIVTSVFVQTLSCNVPNQFTKVSGNLAHIVKGMDDYMDRVKTISEVIAVLCQTDVYDIIPARFSEENRLSIISNLEIPDHIMDRIKAIHFVPPMLVPPKKVECNTDSPYLTDCVYKPLILKHYNCHNQYLNTHAINTLNSIAWSLDTFVLGIDEEPDPDFDEYQLEQFIKFTETSKQVYQYLLDNGNKFYLPHFLDARGREYMRGYHVNLQGSEYRKALMNLAHKEIIPLD